MLQGLLKGLVLWIYGLILDGIEYMASALMEVFSMDLSYFESHAPVTSDIISIIMATGWALLIGNLAFQAMRSMTSGLGFEGEDPKILFARTFVFSFLLMANRQICDTGLTLTGTVMNLVGIPNAITINTPEESHLGFFDSSWLLVVIIGLILIFQVIKFFFEIAERYVVLAFLTIMAPLAFGMGGSKNTEDIFKGWARMYGSMCVMMLMNVVFLKLLLSAMSTIPSGAGVLPWLLFVVAIARVARKVDDLVCRIGLNPARTGDPLGRGLPLMLTLTVARSLGKTVAATMSGKGEGGRRPGATGAAYQPRPSPGPGPVGGAAGQTTPPNQAAHQTPSGTAQTSSTTSDSTSQTTNTRQPERGQTQPASAIHTAQHSDARMRTSVREARQEGTGATAKGTPESTSAQPPSRPPLRQSQMRDRIGGMAGLSETQSHSSRHSQDNKSTIQPPAQATAPQGKTTPHEPAVRERAGTSVPAPGTGGTFHPKGGNTSNTSQPLHRPSRPSGQGMTYTAERTSSSASSSFSQGMSSGSAPSAVSRRNSPAAGNPGSAAEAARPSPHRNRPLSAPGSEPPAGSAGARAAQESASTSSPAPQSSHRNTSPAAPKDSGKGPTSRRNAAPEKGTAGQPPQRPPLGRNRGDLK